MNTKPSSRYPFSVIRERLRRHEGPLLDFALGRHVDPPPVEVGEMLRRHAELALVRCPPAELEAFVSSAVQMLDRVYGVQAPPAILPAPGGRAAMAALAAVAIGPGDTVLVTEPTYPAFARVAAEHRASLVAAQLDPRRGFAPDLRSIRGELAGRIRLAAFNYPNNPTGAVPSPEALAVMDGAIDAAVWFNDAAYGPLVLDGPPFSLLATDLVRPDRVVLELHSLAKLFALGPLSVAFLAGDAALLDRIQEFSEFASAPMSELQIRIARWCLDDEQHVPRVRDGVRDRMERLRSALVELGFEPFPTQGGIYLLCRVPPAVGERRVAGASEAAEELLSRHGVAVVPWDGPPHGYLRFSSSYLPRELDALIDLSRGKKLVGQG